MKRITLFSLFAVILYLGTSFRETSERWFCEELKYTYQIEVFDTRRQIQVTSDLCEIIERNRKADTENFVQLYSNVRLKIFSENQVQNNLSEIPQIVYHN